MARLTELVESVDLDAHLAAIREALADGRRPAAGGLLGLPELEGDVWIDIAGAAAVVGVGPRTITGWLTRGRPASSPFPAAHRFLYRLYWPLSVIEEWARHYRHADDDAERLAAPGDRQLGPGTVMQKGPQPISAGGPSALWGGRAVTCAQVPGTRSSPASRWPTRRAPSGPARCSRRW